jgi:6-pyruvoyl-tetrahydropterin synthase
MDFSDLKMIVEGYLDTLDHCLLLNECDPIGEMVSSVKEFLRVKKVPFDPTAERLAEEIFKFTEGGLKQLYNDDNVIVDYVTVYENENSKATYTKD